MPAPADRPALHVMAAVIRDPAGRVLIAKRAAQADQGGLWEFPGGKLEPGEARVDGLVRELEEELGIAVQTAAPMLQVTHDYPNRRVLLDVFEVTAWGGDAHGREGQPLRWVDVGSLLGYSFPAANLPIVTAARLPRLCLVTPQPTSCNDPGWFMRLEACLANGIRLVQLRAAGFSSADYAMLARRVVPLVQAAGAKVVLNAEPALALELGADGVHLGSRRLRALASRPLPSPLLVSAACHDATELALAQRLQVDFLLVSPVAETRSHPGAPVLGFEGLSRLAAAANRPCYALGGMTSADLPSAMEAGCLGIAAISGLWAEGRD